MINYNLCEIEGGKERKNKVQLDQRKEFEKELQLDQCKGESEREIKKEVEASGESERNKQTKERNGLKIGETLSLFSFSFIVSHNICLHIYFS